jgi:hypothetical protein
MPQNPNVGFSNGPRIAAVFLLLAAITLLIASCGGSDAPKTVRGLLTDVQAHSISLVETLTIEEQGTGERWTFQSEGDIGFTPSHLRAHMLQAETVTVHYEERDGRLLAVKVAD